MTEDQWKARVVLPYLRGRGGEWIAIPRSRFGRTGIPDILGCYRGVFVAFELKSPDSSYEATATQMAQLKRIRLNGGSALVARSLEDIAGLLDLLDREPKGKT